MNNSYEYKDYPLGPDIAKALIVRLFEGEGSVGLKDIISNVSLKKELKGRNVY